MALKSDSIRYVIAVVSAIPALYSLYYLIQIAFIPLLLLTLSTPFIERKLPRRCRGLGYIAVEVSVLIAILVTIGSGHGLYPFASVLASAQTGLAIVLCIDLIWRKETYGVLSDSLISLAVSSESIYAILYSQKEGVPLYLSFIYQWYETGASAAKFLTTGYALPPLVSTHASVLMFLLAPCVFISIVLTLIYRMASEGRLSAERMERFALSVITGGVMAGAVLSLVSIFPQYGLLAQLLPAAVVVAAGVIYSR
jgi:hypothetical protein